MVLGVGGGSVVQLIKKYWPKVIITGIEIDPEIIRISYKHFGLDKIANLKIVNTDALDFIIRTREKFDLIIVDLYIGYTRVPIDDKNLKKILAGNGIIIFIQLKNGKNTFRIIQ